MLNNTRIYTLASITGGLLLWLGWPPFGWPLTLFIGFIPLLWIEHHISETRPTYTKSYLLMFAYLFFLVWNALTTWWIWNATPGGALFAIFANAALMCIPFMLFHVTKKHLSTCWGYLSLPVYWMGFEYGHHLWEFSWPWLTLGNGLANVPTWIQWYEWTGYFGGTLWIWMLNLLIFRALRQWAQPQLDTTQSTPWLRKIRPLAWPVLLFIVPLLLSLSRYHQYESKGKTIETVVVQPNVDPYNEKFSGIPAEEQLERLLNLSEQKLTDTTDLLVWSETALIQSFKLNELEEHETLDRLRKFLQDYPHLHLLTGFSPHRIYESRETASPTAREYAGGNCCYDSYNSAFLLHKSGAPQTYHKSKLVPGVERLPYPAFFSFLAPITQDLGGIMGSLGTQPEPAVFQTQSPAQVAPTICYESIFGDYLTEYIRKGANLICIITNDAWWGDTPGYRQHCAYAPLRAIETRKSIARSANTGISAFINQRGDFMQKTDYWKQASIRDQLHINPETTFFARHGNFLGYGSGFLSIFGVFLLILKGLKTRFWDGEHG
jgi:apolipoprotein N-acyltransferase